jgi:hypothetical protein
MHTAPIVRVGVDAACKLMVTGSDDKSARLRDARQTSSPLRPIRRSAPTALSAYRFGVFQQPA